MGSVATYQEVLTIIAPCVTMALGALIWFYTKLGEERKAREEGFDECRDAREALIKELASFREQVARENVTHQTLEKFETRLIMTVDKLGDRIDRAILTSHTTIVK